MANVEKTYKCTIYEVEIDGYTLSIKCWTDCYTDFSDTEILSIQDSNGNNVELSFEQQTELYDKAVEEIEKFNKEN